MSGLRELDTRGYTVVRGFLGSDEIAYFQADYQSRPLAANDSYPVRSLSPAALARLRSSERSPCIELGERAARESRVSCDLVVDAVYFGIRDGVNFSWHQDHESYYLYQDHRNYLNFFVPIFKPQRHQTNLCVIPFDKLAEHEPELCKKLLYRGGTTFFAAADKYLVLDACAGGILGSVAQRTIEQITHVPELDAGDLLLMRGDVLHRTQDCDTARVALSVRMANSQTIVEGRELVRGGLAKLLISTGNRADFYPRVQAFATTRKQRLSIGELERCASEHAQELPSERAFLRQLLAPRSRDELLQLQAEIATVRRIAGTSQPARAQLERIAALQLDSLLQELRAASR